MKTVRLNEFLAGGLLIVFGSLAAPVQAQSKLRCGTAPQSLLTDRAACKAGFLPQELPAVDSALTSLEKEQRIDLSACFTEEVSQGREGTCYAFAASSLIEAALRRRDGKLVKTAEEDFMAHNFRASYATRPTFREERDANLKVVVKKRKKTWKSFWIFDGGNTSKSLLESLRLGYVNRKDPSYSNPHELSFNKMMTEAELSQDNSREFAASLGQPTYLVVDRLAALAQEQIARRPDSISTHGIALKNLPNNKTTTAAAIRLGPARAAAGFLEERIIRLDRYVKMGLKDVAEAQNAEERNRQQEFVDKFQGWLTTARADYEKMRPAFAECYQSAKPTLDWILGELCAGRPVALAIASVNVRSPAHKEGESPSSYMIGGMHALLAIGVARDPVSKEPHLILRDSAALGKRGWLPFSRACRIMSADSLAVDKIDPSEDFADAIFKP